MIPTYNMRNFGQRLKNIREECGYTQRDVNTSTGINKDTISKLENGKSYPRLDTLVLLSKLYKIDLTFVYSRYKYDYHLYKLFVEVDLSISDNNIEKLKNCYIDFNNHVNSSQNIRNEIADQISFEQLDAFFKSISALYDKKMELALSFSINALKKTIPNFEIEIFNNFKYDFLEYRILFMIATILGKLRNITLSNQILLKLEKTIDSSMYSSYSEKLLYTKIVAMISYNYHRLSDDNYVIKWATIGINFCINSHISYSLPLLLSRKGIALFNMKDEKYIEYLYKSLLQLKISGSYKMFDVYQKIYNEQYNINLNELESKYFEKYIFSHPNN